MPQSVTSPRGLYVIAFASAVVSTLGWVLYIVGSTGGTDLSAIAEPAARLEAMAARGGTDLIYGWGGTIGALLTIPYLLGIAYALASAGPQRWLAYAAGLVGAVLTAVAFMMVLSGVYFMLPAALSAPAEQTATYLVAIEMAAAIIEAPWFLGSFLVYGLAIGWLAWLGLRGGVGPAWLNWIGIAGAIAGLIWLRHFIPILLPLTLIGSLANVVLVSVWAIGATWVVMRVAD